MRDAVLAHAALYHSGVPHTAPPSCTPRVLPTRLLQLSTSTITARTSRSARRASFPPSSVARAVVFLHADGGLPPPPAPPSTGLTPSSSSMPNAVPHHD
ncbi:hypothetical protein BRADI_3g60595v3 [Brachypodium distachyon]|uniref:Uncharacterized protein n=1 Tax=Brachypodium distachyon TaxID=15368 RepID=A0A2K2D634_BRADI|nr:hypothetical protein BRADI_3g60595v3 [Brachypodium distachyon]